MREIHIPCNYAIFYPDEISIASMMEELGSGISEDKLAELGKDPLALVTAYCEIFSLKEFIDTYCFIPAEPCGVPVWGS